MIRALLLGILGVISKIISTILAPLDLVIKGLFPDFSSMVQNFAVFVNRFLGTSLTYFTSMFPPIFRTTVIFVLTFMISFQAFTLVYAGVTHTMALIRKIKFW